MCHLCSFASSLMRDFARGVSETDCHGATPYSLLTRPAGVDDEMDKGAEFLHSSVTSKPYSTYYKHEATQKKNSESPMEDKLQILQGMVHWPTTF